MKRSAMLSLASQDSRIAFFLQHATTNELERAQDHIHSSLIYGRDWGSADYLDIPMTHQDIADHLCLTIETVSRAISDLKRSKMITRVSCKKLFIRNRLSLGHMLN